MADRGPILGAHMSMAGGFDRAIARGHEVGCRCVQVFTKNNNQWRAPELAPAAVTGLREAMARYRIEHVIAHSSYLINLASPDAELWKKSLEAMVVELRRADQLGIPYVVVHPGAFTTSSEPAGLRRVVRAVNEIHRRTGRLRAECLLENTAGQGTCLGARFEHLARILDHVKAPERLGVCFDTCHAFAAGYPLATRAEYEATISTLGRLVGWDRIRAIHLNDSQRPLGARVDRHAHIGRGQIGITAFAHVLNDERFHAVPMYLETPKGIDPKSGQPWDRINLRRLRRLVGRPVA